jgi:ATP adenylyltransferase
MDQLYAPWRGEYVSGDKKIQGCVFCHVVENTDKDEELGVLYRAEEFFVVMNRYPYSPGHFMIIPNQHTANLEDISEELFCKMSKCARQGVKMLKEVMNANGVNIGMNLGSASGAGIAEHLHMHLVPRWESDTNFMTVISQMRVFSGDFDKIYKKLKEQSANYFR